jgi:hypothetical protein
MFMADASRYTEPNLKEKLTSKGTRPAWARFKTAEEGRALIM